MVTALGELLERPQIQNPSWHHGGEFGLKLSPLAARRMRRKAELMIVVQKAAQEARNLSTEQERRVLAKEKASVVQVKRARRGTDLLLHDETPSSKRQRRI